VNDFANGCVLTTVNVAVPFVASDDGNASVPHVTELVAFEPDATDAIEMPSTHSNCTLTPVVFVAVHDRPNVPFHVVVGAELVNDVMCGLASPVACAGCIDTDEAAERVPSNTPPLICGHTRTVNGIAVLRECETVNVICPDCASAES
jgi:hypothetical protein